MSIAETPREDGRAGLVHRCLAGVLLLTAILFSRALNNGFVYDDRYTIVTNRQLATWSFLWKSFSRDVFWFAAMVPGVRTPLYRPLLDVWFWLNYHLFGLHPAGWHAAGIALHLVAVWLVYRIAARLTADSWTGLAAAAIFAVLPVHAEAVIWSSAASFLLCAVFELAALDFYLRGASEPAANRRTVWMAVSLGFFGGALLSHESAIALPVLIAVHAFLFSEIADPTPCPPSPSEKGERNSESSPLPLGGGVSSRVLAAIATVWPYAIETVAYLALRSWVLRTATWSNSAIYAPLTHAQAALMIPGALAREAMLFVVPWMAGPTYPLKAVAGVDGPEFYLPLTAIVVVSAAAIVLLWRARRRRFHLFCVAWMLIAAAPLASLNILGLLVAGQNRYLYFPSVGFCLMAASLAIAFARRGKRDAILAGAGVGAFAIACAIALFSVQRFWYDDVALHSNCVEHAPHSAFCRDLLAQAFEARGDLAQAQHQFERAAALDPNRQWNAFHDLSRVDALMGDRAGAERAMAEWLKRLPAPAPGAYAEMALAADAAGDAKGVDDALAHAERIQGGANAAALVRAQIRFRHGDRAGAEAALNNLVRNDPEDAQALNVLGAVLIADNRYADALAAFRRAEPLAPGDPGLHYRIALALHYLGRDREARMECERTLAIAPGDRAALELMPALERAGSR
ncbi:MAG: tetratricopeptide repeat protein [Candidatus Binataceae bacterium]